MKALKFIAIISLAIFTFGCADDAPDAAFSYEILNGGKVIFTNNSSGIVRGYNWAFGDGDSSTHASPVHQYRSSGMYEVKLWIENDDGSSEFSEVLDIVMDDDNPIEKHITFNNAAGMLYATNQIKYIVDDLGNQVEEKYGEALAVFYTDGFTVSAGIVACAGTELNLLSNNLYTFSALDSSLFAGDTLFYFSGDVNWSVYGGNGIPTVIQTTKQDFPVVSEIIKQNPANEPEEVDVSVDYYLTTFNPIVGADSLIYQVFDENGNILLEEVTDDIVGAYTISSEDLSSFPKGTATFAIRAFNYEDKLFKGRRIYFINESVISREVILK